MIPLVNFYKYQKRAEFDDYVVKGYFKFGYGESVHGVRGLASTHKPESVAAVLAQLVLLYHMNWR